MADGKIYVGTESGKFFIVRPRRRPRRDPERGRAADQHEQLLQVRGHARADSRPARPISRGRIFFVSSDAVYAIGPRRPTTPTGLRGRRAGGRRRGRAGVRAGVADRAGAEAGPDRQAARAALRRQGPVPARGDAATWSLDGLKGTVDRRRVHRRRRSGRAGRPRSRRPSAALTGEARARVVAPAAVERDVRLATPTAPCRAGWVNAVAGKFSVDDARRPEGAAEGAGRHHLQAHPHVHRAGRLVELHLRGRRPRADAAAADGRHRHHRAALLAGALRQLAAAEARAVGAGDAADGHGAVRLEAGHLVSPQAARREPAERPGARAGQGLADRRARAGGTGRSRRSIRSATARARPACSSTRSSARISTT